MDQDIYKYFYKEVDKEKPANIAEFLKQLKCPDKNKYILTNGMGNFIELKLKDVISKTQMRNIFEAVKEVKEDKDLRLLQVKLMYTAGRLSDPMAKNFIRFVMEIFKDKDNIEIGKSFMESALAYHKFYAKNN